MTEKHVNNIDLNLLVALDVLMQERHITNSAIRLGITQPAMSRTLVRLRETFNDPLIVRTLDGYVSTPRAETLIEPVKNILAQIQWILSDQKFDPATATGEFKVCTLGYGEIVVIPTFMELLSKVSPDVGIVIVNRSLYSSTEALDGKADIVFGALLPDTSKSWVIQPLYEDRFYCVMSKTHPLAKHELTLDRYLEYPHSIIHTGERPGLYPVDTALAKLGYKRKIAKSSPHWTSALISLGKTNLLQTVPGLMARSIANTGSYVVKPLPFDMKPVVMGLMWHSRNNNDPRHKWFRDKFSEAAMIISAAS